jgi:hypothetical protein
MTAAEPAKIVPVAVNVLADFVLDVDYAELNWMWDVLRDTLEAIANASADEDDPESYPAALAEAWQGFFIACEGGDAIHLVVGLSAQWIAACPAERRAEQQVVTRRAYVAGWGRSASTTAQTPYPRRATPRPTLTLLEGGLR